MADEEVENLPPKEGEGEEKKKGGGIFANPIVPLLIVVLMVPLLSFVMMKYIFFPDIKAAVLDVVVKTQKELEEAEEGKTAQVQTYEFKDVVANLSGALHSRYVKVSFMIEGTSKDFKEKIEKSKPKLLDSALSTLSSLTIMDLEQPGVKNMIRSDLLTAFEVALNDDMIQQLYFTEFVVQ